jgi:hypothetical protein
VGYLNRYISRSSVEVELKIETITVNVALDTTKLDAYGHMIADYPTDGTRYYWVPVESNQTRTHILKSYPLSVPAPAPVHRYTFCPIPTSAQIKKTRG